MPPDHPESLPPIPYSPDLATVTETEKNITQFESNLRSIFETFFLNDVQLPLWEPPSGPDAIRSHIAGLKIPIISQGSQFPSLLLHNLGQPSHDAQLAERVDELFRPEQKK
jgi:hypothetical protein